MRVLVCDDEAPARQRLCQLLTELDTTDCVGEAANGKQALQLCEQTRPDIVLLDIRMPVMDGLEAARHLALQQQPPAVIFTTAYGDHALSAFEANAVDYLLKPIRRERLNQALHKAHGLNRAQWQALSSTELGSQARSHLAARRQERLQLIPVEDIYYLQADQKYVTVRHHEGEDLIEDSLKSLAEEFSGRFVRIHRNALVAGDYLIGIEKSDNGHVAIIDGCEERLEISRRHASAVRKWLKDKAS